MREARGERLRRQKLRSGRSIERDLRRLREHSWRGHRLNRVIESGRLRGWSLRG
jgi:hypothetical protein